MKYYRAVVYQDEALRRLQRFVDAQFTDGSLRNVLDAGCGYTLPLDFGGSVRLVGLDASPEALAKNLNIDAGIVGDVETYPLEPGTFDAVLCWQVLEHLRHPRAALANMARALRPGGLLIVGIPNVWSLKGLLTRFTPHVFHVWVYRRVLGKPDAGKPGFAPFPTYLRRDIAPRRLAAMAREHDLENVYVHGYEIDLGLPRAVGFLWSFTTTLATWLTLGRWQAATSDHIAVFRKGPFEGSNAEGAE